MSPRRIRRAAIYARLSVTTEESVSIEGQIESARRYAEARGWDIVGEFSDDGVSATKVKPEDRPGWRALLGESAKYDAVIVWKVDRLARRVLDFLHADETLQARGAGIVAVEDPVDMTTAQGRAFATMLAVFGEMEGAAMSARATAARATIVSSGRRAGGRPPFGWMNVPNPNGPGVVLAKDPERIGVVEELAQRALAGEPLGALVRWLESEGIAPRPRAGRKTADEWNSDSVETILRNPVLAGMVPHTPGRKPKEDRPVEVVRGADGLPVIFDQDVAIITAAERRSLLAALDSRKRPGSRPGGVVPALLTGLLECGTCRGPMYRATAGGLRSYRCQAKKCTRRVGVNRAAIEAHVERVLLDSFGRWPAVRIEEVDTDPAPLLADIQAAISETLAAMDRDDADMDALRARLDVLKAARATARAEETGPSFIERHTGETVAEAWAAAGDNVEAKRVLLLSAIETIKIAPAARGERLSDARVDIVWRDGDIDPD